MSKGWITLAADLLAAHSGFVAVARQLAPARRDQAGVCGAWSPKDIMAHLIGWDAEAVRGFEMFANDEGDRFNTNLDVHAFNEQSVQSRRHLSWEAVIAELQRTQATLQEIIAVVEGKGLCTDGGFGKWLIGRKLDYEEHTGQLQAWVDGD